MIAWYYFKGQNALGNTVQGEHKADSEIALTAHLKTLGVTAFTIKRMSLRKVLWLHLKRMCFRLIPIRRLTLSTFYFQLAGMLEIGISIKNSLLVISSHLDNPRFVTVIDDILDKLTKGYTLAGSMKKHTALFSEVVLRLVSLASSKSELVAVLRYCDKTLKHFLFVRKLLYLIIPQLAFTALMITSLLFVRLHYYGNFQYAIYVFQNPEPLKVKVFVFLTGLMTVHLGVSILIAMLLVAILKLLTKHNLRCRYVRDYFFLKIPIVQGVILAKERERLALIYSVLLEGGATVQKCALYASSAIENLCFQKRVVAMANALHQGDSFSSALKRFNIFSSAEVQLIGLGVASNNLSATFSRVYEVSQMILEKKFMLLTESARVLMYAFNITLFIFTVMIVETMFFYPGSV